WNSDRQTDYENSIARLTASAGLPLSWVDNPEFIAFKEKFIPAAKPVTRKVLTKRIIPRLVKTFRQKAMAAVKQNKYVTLQADGWTGENHHHYIAFMITSGGKLYTVKVHDASTERKTFDRLLIVLEAVFTRLEAEWGAVVVAVVTDASGESRKARREFVKTHPWVVVLDCFAHQ
ncbi:hypothetical protein BJ165DRAFT_1307486, partial [Panaeolus papilionaceus]